MAQIFWEQIRNELPAAGEFLTGSLNVSGSFGVTGSLSIDLDGINDEFIISVIGDEKVKVNKEGVLQLLPYNTPPTPIQGGVFYSGSDSYYLGFIN